MAITALHTGTGRIKFMTVQKEGYIDLDIQMCDEDFKPKGEPSIGVHPMTEVEYHTNLRQRAQERGHYVPSESTNPEWNPENVTN